MLFRSDFIRGNPRKNGNKLRSRINSADFSDETRAELLDKLFRHENSREIKASKVIGTMANLILLPSLFQVISLPYPERLNLLKRMLSYLEYL